MHFKVSIRINPATGNPGGYYRLVESYRNIDGRVCHRTMLNVGFIDGTPPEELNRIQKILNYKCQLYHDELFPMEFDEESPNIKKWVDELYSRLLTEKKIDVPIVQKTPVSCELDNEQLEQVKMDLMSKLFPLCA